MRNETCNPLINYIYDANYERIRKYQLEKYIMRPREKNEEEKNVIEEIRKLEQVCFINLFKSIFFRK